MKYLASTIVEYIVRETAGESVFRFILPSYEPSLLLRIGQDLEEHFIGRGPRVRFLYGVAYRLGQEWSRSASEGVQRDFAELRARGWYNEGNNLTSLRNEVRDPAREDTLVTLIAGYDHLDDRASLRDFFHLDDRAIWTICLKRSFRRWLEARFAQTFDARDEAPTLDKMDELAGAILERGLADLSGISRYLEGLSLDEVTTAREAYELMLKELGAFKLPPLVGLARARGKKRPADYISRAQDFASYALFLDDSQRRKALGAIDRFVESHQDEELDAEVLGAFGSLDEMLKALRRYITERSAPDRERLLQADFVYLNDQVLGAKSAGPRSSRAPAARKLQGLAPEVFLRALWLTLGDYSDDCQARGMWPAEDLVEITLQSTLFKHDFDAGETDDADGSSDQELARAFLHRALGGLDQLLEDRIELKREGGELIPLHSRLCPGEQNKMLAYHKTSVAEPTFAFRVTLTRADKSPFHREFLWRLPQNHPARLLVSLFAWALDSFRHGGNALPAYAAPHMPEIFMARDEDEVNRLLGVALSRESRRMVNLLSAQGIAPDDPALRPLLELSRRYQVFLGDWESAGFFAALASSYDALRQAYTDAGVTFLRRRRESALQPLMLKAFLLVDAASAADKSWMGDPKQLPCAVATPLHPAVLDMIRHQHVFLCDSFCACANGELTERRKDWFAAKTWNRMVDLAQISRPILGTLKAEQGTLDSRVRSYGYFHLVGQCRAPSSGSGARLLLEYEDEEDDEITDAELFRETPASALVQRTLVDYAKLHSHADDGLAIGAYCGREVQPIIAGIDAFLEEKLPARNGQLYGLRITIYSAGRDDSAVMSWLDAWRNRWQEAELAPGKQHYGNCRITIAYRVVTGEQSQEQLARLIGQTTLDVMFLTDFVEEGTSRFEPVERDDPPSTTDYRKFPVLEKACCTMNLGGQAQQRQRILSQPLFTLATLHAELMAGVSLGWGAAPQQHVVMSESDLRPWKEVLSAAHQSSAWVVCVDASVDEQVLRSAAQTAGRKREIIGFGTGVGAHSESNYTISTEQYSLADVKQRIAEQLASRLGPWGAPTCERIAQTLIGEAEALAGLSVVKATGPSEYVRDYIAYAAMRRLLPRDPCAFCDEIISLDAFRHWFDGAQDKTRPDLLRLQAYVVNGYLDVRAQVIECKLANWSDELLGKARNQVEAGLKRLVPCFAPRPEGENPGLSGRPDQRYWWMQLHRLLASRGSVSRIQYMPTFTALERLAEGLFTISWQGAVIAIWTDQDRERFEREMTWVLDIEGDELVIPALTAGRSLVRRVGLGEAAELPLETRPIQRSFRSNLELDSIAPRREGLEQEAGERCESHKPTGQIERPESHEPAATDARAGLEPIEREPVLARQREAELVPTPTSEIAAPRAASRILLGQMIPGGREVYWEFGHPELTNRHILVFGASGAGKTYTIQALLCELGRAGHNSVIVDYTNGFMDNQLEQVMQRRVNPKQHIVRVEPLPINPFRQQYDLIGSLRLEEDPTMTAQRVTGVFSEVYQLGDQQKSALYSTIRDGITTQGAAFNLEMLAEGLAALREAGGPVAASAASLLSRIQPFVDMRPFGKENLESWETLYTDPVSRCHIIQLAGYSKDIAQLITEFSLVDLYRYYRANGNKDKPRVVVLDEIQNLDHSQGSPLGQLLTEGRKFGISLILATQTLSNLDKEERDRLFQASHKLFFKPADTELRSFAQILENATGEKADDWVRKLSSLSRGECYSLGPAQNDATGGLDTRKYFKLRILPLEKRF